MSTLTVKYLRKRIVPSNAAMREMMKLGMALDDVLDILTNGQDAPRRRQKGKIERWLRKGKKTYNAVVTEDYNDDAEEEVWVLIHLGKFTTKK